MTAKSLLGQQSRGLLGGFVHRIIRAGAGAAEDRDGLSQRRQCFKSFDEFRHDPENAPAIGFSFVGGGAGVREVSAWFAHDVNRC